MTTKQLQELAQNNNGKLPAYAWPGGYPILYLDQHNETLCAECATRDLNDPDTDDKPVAYDVYYEGPNVFCAECNKEIESAYGDPGADEDQS